MCAHHVWPFATPWRLCPGGFPGKNTGVGCHFHLPGIFQTQVLNHVSCVSRWVLYHWATEAKSDRTVLKKKSIIIVEDLNRLLSVTDDQSIQKIITDIVDLSGTINILLIENNHDFSLLSSNYIISLKMYYSGKIIYHDGRNHCIPTRMFLYLTW